MNKTLYFVTHKDSAPTKKRKHWDFLAVCPTLEEATRLDNIFPDSTGVVAREVKQ